jgi:hypothetical protein
MISLTITDNNLRSTVELEDDATSTEMIERFCRLLLLQTYQIGSIINSLDEVRQDLIEEVKIAYEDFSDE